MSKVISGIAKKVKKTVKRVVSSKIGKFMLIAATIYIGGAALGAWGSPFTSINGVLAGGAKAGASAGTTNLASLGSTASTGTTAAAGTAGGTAGTVNLGSLGAGAGTGTAATTTAAGGTINLGSLGATGATAGTAGATTATTGAGAAAATPTVAAPAAGTTTAPAAGFTSPVADIAKTGIDAAKTVTKTLGSPEAKKGIISRMMESKLMTTAMDNPIPTAMLLSAAGSAAGPDEIDMIREQAKQQEQTAERDRLRREKNMDLAGINLNMRPTNSMLKDSSGNQVYGNTGIINRSRSML